MLAASVAPCVLVTMMLGAQSFRKRRVEGATRDLGPSALRLRSVLLPFGAWRPALRDAGRPGEASDHSRVKLDGDWGGALCSTALSAVGALDSVRDSCCSASCASVAMAAQVPRP